jgi:hypothetical protein
VQGNSYFLGRSIGKFSLGVKEKGATTTYLVKRADGHGYVFFCVMPSYMQRSGPDNRDFIDGDYDSIVELQ